MTDEKTDVVSDVLETLRFKTLLFGRFELGAPWALRLPSKVNASFYVVTRGGLRLQVEGSAQPMFLSAGDVVLLPRATAHVLDDGARKVPRDFIPPQQLRAAAGTDVRLGGPGATTTLITGCFQFGVDPTHPLLRAFPPIIHLSTQESGRASSLAATVQLLSAETAEPGPGSALVVGRLADVLLVQALRAQALLAQSGDAGWKALANPAIGNALALMHEQPGAPWTVERLAAAVGLSRSGFAARFHSLVGETPLHYLSNWRMTRSARWLHESDDSLDAIAERAGYESAPAFSKAFKRRWGMGPGAYRRTPAPRVTLPTSFDT
ncbi:AraC family transcriptional regulator [Corallococcus praedator]|uniref:AraC family transcriptional regulator n=1 Tax=Corallococcus praedator TaxID=2316724 RepID=A0ABX9QNS7_9BACT|nr:AraC family transcriptional regulator [Corallococcus sp. CA031C]RKH34702.1 AraC family transcriptional regulator [Corallococcus sp. CA031C]RKI14597.1 AraC family transcriptional regulator [Corallococcus praedator]